MVYVNNKKYKVEDGKKPVYIDNDISKQQDKNKVGKTPTYVDDDGGFTPPPAAIKK